MSNVALPPGVQLASVGRRIGSYFLSIVLVIVTLVIGYVIWGLIAWGKGTSPAWQVLGLKAYNPQTGHPATWGKMALRNIVGGIVQGILGAITSLISFIMFLASGDHKSIPDNIAGVIVVHDPNKVFG
jgi:uncharacterized RDD family membrane protein YckC